MGSRTSAAALAEADEDWYVDALCVDADTDWFFPVGYADQENMAHYCTDCPVRVECGEFALATNQEAGIWGGMTEEARRRERRRRARQR